MLSRRVTNAGCNRWAVLLLLVAVACGGATRLVLLDQPEQAPADVRQGCDVASVRCSSCHTLDRILAGTPRNHEEWERQVERMRLMPASGITTTDAEWAVKCLTYRDQLRGASTAPTATP